MGKFLKFCSSVWNHWEARFGTTFAVILAAAQYLYLAVGAPARIPKWVKEFPPYLWLSIGIALFFWACYGAWSEQYETRLEIEQKYFNERPLLGVETHSVEGPETWRNHPVPVSFSLHHLSGRVPTAIHFDPVPSLLGNLRCNSIRYPMSKNTHKG